MEHSKPHKASNLDEFCINLSVRKINIWNKIDTEHNEMISASTIPHSNKEEYIQW
jgi:hypothetical protein